MHTHHHVVDSDGNIHSEEEHNSNQSITNSQKEVDHHDHTE